MTRALVRDLVVLLGGAVVVAALSLRSGWEPLVAAVVAVVMGRALEQLGAALLQSLAPRTRGEARMLRRIGEDMLRRARERAVQPGEGACPRP